MPGGWYDGSTVLFEAAYTRADTGRIDAIDNETPGYSGYDWSYSYDYADRLLNADNTDGSLDQSFTYDAGGNMLSNSLVGSYIYPSATSPRPHTPTSVAGQSLSYDANGNMTSGRGRTIVYDHENRPTTVSIGGSTVTYAYGPNGERVTKVKGADTTTWLGGGVEILPTGTPPRSADRGRVADGAMASCHR